MASSQSELSFLSAMSWPGLTNLSCSRRLFLQLTNTKLCGLGLLEPFSLAHLRRTPADSAPSITDAEQMIHTNYERRQASASLSAPPSTHGSPGHMPSLTHRQATRSGVNEEELRRRWA